MHELAIVDVSPRCSVVSHVPPLGHKRQAAQLTQMECRPETAPTQPCCQRSLPSAKGPRGGGGAESRSSLLNSPLKPLPNQFKTSVFRRRPSVDASNNQQTLFVGRIHSLAPLDKSAHLEPRLGNANGTT